MYNTSNWLKMGRENIICKQASNLLLESQDKVIKLLVEKFGHCRFDTTNQILLKVFSQWILFFGGEGISFMDDFFLKDGGALPQNRCKPYLGL